VYDALHKGAMFINADQTLGATPAIEKMYQENWLKRIRLKGCTEADVNAALERMKADKTASLRTQLLVLESAGFGEVECWFKNYRFAVYSGKKL
jgi:tRNA (cmo5U34)-methyltransferase